MQSRFTRRFAACSIEPLERRTLLAAVNIAVNNAQVFQTIEGFGASMTPWDLKAEYTDPAFFDLIVNDLGASMARAAILPTAEKVNDNNDPNTFNWAGFDHTALAMPFEFFKSLQDRGVSRFVGSVWTAPAWMKTNQIYTDGGSLRPDMRAEFAEYLSAVTKLAKDDYGVDLTALSPQNEPYFVEPYESTTYNADQLREAVRAVMRKFAADGVDTELLVPEDLIFEHRNQWYLSRIMNDPETRNFIGNFAGHGLLGHWNEVRQVFESHGRDFWMTETSGHSTSWQGAMGLAGGILNAIGTANASSYLYWQFSEDPADEKFALLVDGAPTSKYYAAKQFYRWIRPGFVHVGSSTSLPEQIKTASFRNPANGAMTHVIVNQDGDPHDITFNVSGSSLPGTYKVYRSSSSEQAKLIGNIAGGSSFSLNVPGLSITTITSAPELTPKTGGAMNPALKPTSVRDFVSANNFFKASLKGYISSLTAQINGGANVNQVAPNGWTALHVAGGSVHTGSLLTAQALIDAGANVSAVNNEGWTALHAAAANTFLKFDSSATAKTRLTDKINLLINAGIDVNAKDNNGRTALHWAAWMGAIDGTVEDTQAVDALLARGADPFIKDNFGKTALDYARSEQYKRIPDPLIKAMGLDKVKPTGDILDVTPDPRPNSVTDFFIKFSERVVGFDLADIVLTRNGVNVEFPIGAALTTEDEINYQLSGFGGDTAAPGQYVLKVVAAGSGITDPSGNALAADFADSWTNGDTPPPPPTDQTPFNGSPFSVTTSGPVKIEMEQFDNGGEGVAHHDVDSANLGGAYRTGGVDIQASTDSGGGHNIGYVKAGEWLEYSIDVASAGTYDLGLRVASMGSNGKFHVEVDGADVTGALTVPNSGGWQKWQTLPKTGVNLSAGTHVLRVAFDANGSTGSVGNFNYLTISPQGNPPPPPPPDEQTPYKGVPFIIKQSDPTTIQVEDFDNGGEGIAYHDTDSANNGGTYRSTRVDIQPTTDGGGGHNVAYTKAGEWLEYTLNVTETGSYDLGIRVASMGSNGKFHVEIDGVNISGALTVPNTGGWQKWTNVPKTGVNLSAGTHVLRLVMDANSSSGSVGNFNYLTISPQGTPPPPPPTNQAPYSGSAFAIGSGTATIQLEDFDHGGEAIAFHDIDSANQGGKYRTTAVDISGTTDTGGGFNIGWVKAGEWLEYTIDVATAGDYDLVFRTASAGAGGKFHAEIDGSNVTSALTVPNTSGWQTWSNVTKSGVALPAGEHVLRVFMESNGATGSVGNFNHLKITPTTTPPPPTQTPFKGTPFAVGATPVTIQAEDFDNGGEGIAYHDLDSANIAGAYRNTAVDIELSGDTGGGYHVGYTGAGEWLEYTLNVATAGSYNFDFRTASNGLGGKFRALIDGVNKTDQFQVPNTNSWNSFTTVPKAGVSLSAGTHVLRLAFDTTGGSGFAGNFNWIRISKA